MSAPSLAALIAAEMAFLRWKDRRRTDAAISERDLVSDIWVAFRRVQDTTLDETGARIELNDHILTSGIKALKDWQLKHLYLSSEADKLALNIWVSFDL